MRVLVSVVAVGLLALCGCFFEAKRSGGSDKGPEPVAAPEPEGDPKVAPMPREVTRPRSGEFSGPPDPPRPRGRPAAAPQAMRA